MCYRILVVEDDQALADRLQALFHRQGHLVTVTNSANQAFHCLKAKKYDLCVVDRVLIDGDGLQVVEYAESSHYSTKTLLLSAQSTLEQRIQGLQAGASDYLPKPFSYQELQLKVDKLLLSDKRSPSETKSYKNVLLSVETGELFISGERQSIRPRELLVLDCLIRHRRQVVTRETLITQIWGDADEPPLYQTIDVYVRRVRQVLKDKGPAIRTIRFIGYMLE
jgi:two-component system, OmpR family, response regulator